MIENETQLRLTKVWVDKFTKAMEGLPVDGIDPVIFKAHTDALRSMAEDLQAEVTEYEKTRKEQEPVKRRCNRHNDCAAAEEKWRPYHPNGVPANFHCHDDECEECFGQ